jgi:hypothetical protein
MPSAKTTPARTAKAYQVLPVSDMTGGLDLRSAQTLMRPERARSLVNWSLEQPGALVVRPGWRAYSSTSLGSGRIQGAARVYLNTAIPNVASTAATIAAYQGGVYLQTESSGIWANGASPTLTGLSTANDVFFPHDRDMVAVFDGATAPFKSTNGSSWTRMGITRGATAPTLSSVTGGSLSAAEFELSYTYKDRDLAYESNGASTQSTITLGATGAISIIVPNSTDPQVDAIVVYARNKTSGETIRRKASSQTQSTGANSTIVVTSSNWATNAEEPSDHTPAGVYSFGVVWKNRWWARSATVKNRLHFTQLFQPQSWPSLFYLDIPFERGDEIRALQPIGDSLIVFGTTKIFVIVGQTSLDFEVRPTLDSQGGAFGPRSVCTIENGIVHLDVTGALIFDGATDRLLSNDLDPAIRDLVQNASIADLRRIPVAYDSIRKELRVSVPRKYPSGTRGEFILDLNRTNQSNGASAWTETDRTIGGYLIWDGPEAQSGDRGRVLTWHSSKAQLYEENVGTTADGAAMVAEYEGPGLTLGNRRGRWVDVRGEVEPSGGSFAIEPHVDGVSQGSQNINVAGSGAKYGISEYGSGTYGGAARKMFSKNFPLACEGHTLTLKAVYNGTNTFRWYTYEPGLVPETQARGFSE